MVRPSLRPPLTPFVDALPLPRRILAGHHGGKLTVAIRAATHRSIATCPPRGCGPTTAGFRDRRSRPSVAGRSGSTGATHGQGQAMAQRSTAAKVQCHLGKVLTKLAISSRSQLDRVLPSEPTTAQAE